MKTDEVRLFLRKKALSDIWVACKALEELESSWATGSWRSEWAEIAATAKEALEEIEKGVERG